MQRIAQRLGLERSCPRWASSTSLATLAATDHPDPSCCEAILLLVLFLALRWRMSGSRRDPPGPAGAVRGQERSIPSKAGRRCAAAGTALAPGRRSHDRDSLLRASGHGPMPPFGSRCVADRALAGMLHPPADLVAAGQAAIADPAAHRAFTHAGGDGRLAATVRSGIDPSVRPMTDDVTGGRGAAGMMSLPMISRYAGVLDVPELKMMCIDARVGQSPKRSTNCCGDSVRAEPGPRRTFWRVVRSISSRSRARPLRSGRRASSYLRGMPSGPPKTLHASPYWATSRSVFCSPPPPTMIGTRGREIDWASSGAARPGTGGPRTTPPNRARQRHLVRDPERLLEHLEPDAQGGNGNPRARDSSTFQAAPMPSYERPPDSTSSVVAALTQSPGLR